MCGKQGNDRGLQTNVQRTLDRIQVQAQFGGYRKTAEASEKVRDAQLEAATMQNQAQKEASEIGSRMGDYRGRVVDLAKNEQWLKEQKAVQDWVSARAAKA